MLSPFTPTELDCLYLFITPSKQLRGRGREAEQADGTCAVLSDSDDSSAIGSGKGGKFAALTINRMHYNRVLKSQLIWMSLQYWMMLQIFSKIKA